MLCQLSYLFGDYEGGYPENVKIRHKYKSEHTGDDWLHIGDAKINRYNAGELSGTSEGMHLRAWLVQRWRDQRGTPEEVAGEPLRIPGGRVGAVKRWSREQVAACVGRRG